MKVSFLFAKFLIKKIDLQEKNAVDREHFQHYTLKMNENVSLYCSDRKFGKHRVKLRMHYSSISTINIHKNKEIANTSFPSLYSCLLAVISLNPAYILTSLTQHSDSDIPAASVPNCTINLR